MKEVAPVEGVLEEMVTEYCERKLGERTLDEAKTDDGPEFVASLDTKELADFLDADNEPEYGRAAIPDDVGQNDMSLVEDGDQSGDWATY